MPLNYNNGKIYKIINSENEVVYIGSTAQEKLCKRFSTHKHRGNGNKIILIEEYPCSSKEQLCMKEQEHIESHENLLNDRRAFNTEEYYKEHYKTYRKEYNEKWRINNKEKVKEHDKKFRENNRDKLNEKRKFKVICECGCEISNRNIATHKKTTKHIDLMNTTTV